MKYVYFIGKQEFDYEIFLIKENHNQILLFKIILQPQITKSQW